MHQLKLFFEKKHKKFSFFFFQNQTHVNNAQFGYSNM